MPVYNVQDYLSACLDCVVEQTLKEIEIICVDDGSTDDSSAILKRYAEKDQRIKVLYQKNQFAGAARNLGLQQAVGKYVIFWDSDDLFDRQALEKLYNQCEEDQAEIGICGAKRMDNASGLIYFSNFYAVKKMLPEKRPFSKREISQYLFNFTTNVPWNKMFLRTFVQKHQLEFQTLRQANDVYFSMVSLFLAERITVLEEPLVTYRMDNTASLTGKASENRYCTREAYQAVWQKLISYPEFDASVRRSFANRALDAMLYSLRTQWNVDAYQELFQIYKEELFPEFGLWDLTEEEIYSHQNLEDLEQIRKCDAMTFLLYDFRSYERRFKNVSGKLANTKAELSSLKKENKRLQKIENSTAFRLGKKLTYLPGKIKRRFSH